MRGAKMVVSLSALAAGATPFQVGLLAALFAAFPLVLAVYAGKLSDRIGVKPPILAGAVIMALGILVPLAVGGLAGLMICSALIGLGHIFFHVSIHNLIGGYGDGEARTRNFATFSLGASVSAGVVPERLQPLYGSRVNLGFGVMSRAAPSLNLFAVGFPITLVFGLGIVYAGLPSVQSAFVESLDAAFATIRALLHG